MVRTMLGSLMGAGVGFVTGLLGVGVMAIAIGEHSDTVAVSFFVGVFLAGAGAIAGAVVGGMADLLAHLRKRDQALRNARGVAG